MYIQSIKPKIYNNKTKNINFKNQKANNKLYTKLFKYMGIGLSSLVLGYSSTVIPALYKSSAINKIYKKQKNTAPNDSIKNDSIINNAF